MRSRRRSRNRRGRGKDEVLAELLAIVMGPHAPGQIGATRHGSLPLPDDRLEKSVVAGLNRDIHRCRRQVEGPYRVTGERHLIPHRDVVLKIRPSPVDVGQRLMPAAIDEQRGLMQVTLLACHPRQLDQTEFDLGVAADSLDATCAEDVTHVIGGPPRYFHELVGPAGPCPGDSSLEHVAIAVQLVSPLQVAVPIGLARPSEDSVQIAIILLGWGDH